MSEEEKQIGGTHYQNLHIQPWDFIIANQLGFLEGCVIKYICRYKHKGGLQDIKKAIHCLEKILSTEEQRTTYKNKEYAFICTPS